MRKTILGLMIGTAALAFTACTPSRITVQSSKEETAEAETEEVKEAEQETKEAETEPVTFAEGEVPTGINGGPGLLPTTTADQSDLPADKQTAAEADKEEIISVYCLDDTGVFQQMDVVPELNEESLIEGLIANEVISPDTELVSFKNNGDGTASLELSELTGVYKKAKEEQLLACIANTFTENLGLTSISIKAGGKDYGVKEYTSEYDRT